MIFNFLKEKPKKDTVVFNNKKIVYNIAVNHLLLNLPVYYFCDGFYLTRDVVIKDCEVMMGGDDRDITYSVGELRLHKIENSNEVMMDNYLLNLETKKIVNLLYQDEQEDSFIKAFNEETSDAKLKLRQNIDASKSVLSNGKEIIKLRKSAIEKIDFRNITEIGPMFLPLNKNLKKINLLNVESVGKYFLLTNKIINKKFGR